MRTLILGLDGGTFDVFRPLVDAGRMPNLQALWQRSACLPLESTEPFITPTAWYTFLTGCDPARHGVLDYRYYDHQADAVRLNHAARTTLPTLFDVAERSGPVVSLNMPMTWPPTARAHAESLIIGGLDAPSTAATLAPYPKFAAELRRRRIRLDLDPIWRRAPRTFTELASGVAQTVYNFHARALAAEAATDLVDWELLFVQFQALDSLQHFVWEHLGLEPLSGSSAPWSRCARAAITALDDSVGRLCELADRRQAMVVAVSDHGFGPFREQISLPALFRARGLQTAATRGQQFRYAAARVTRNVTKWLHRRLSPGSSTAGLARGGDSIVPIDWRWTTAVALHGNLAALVYLNTPERFGRGGPVVNLQQYDQAAAEVIAALLDARHPETGEALFESAYRTDIRYGVEPLARMLPDVVGIPAAGFHTRTRCDAGDALMRPEPALRGTHRREGLLSICAPGVSACHERSAPTAGALRDVLPTLARLWGTAPPAGGHGRALDELLNVPATAKPLAAPAAGWRLDRPHEPAAARHGTADVEERLRALGYLD